MLHQCHSIQDFEITLFSIHSVRLHSNLGSVFSNHLDRWIYRTKFPTHVGFLFPFSTCHVTLTFPLMLKTFLLFIYAQRELPLLMSFSRPGIYVATWKHTGLALSMTRRQDFQNSLSLRKLYLKRRLTTSLHPRPMLLCTTNYARKTHTLWGISRYQRMYNIIVEVQVHVTVHH